MNPKKNSAFEQYLVWRVRLNDAERSNMFITRLRCKLEDYELGVVRDIMDRDKIVFSVPDCKLKEKLL